ncbi:hypothetical protein LguiB_023509 [Lonicera macranthoides]
MGMKLLATVFVISTTITLTLMPIVTYSVPFVVFHGIADKCTSKGVVEFTELLSNWSGTQGYCIEIGDGVLDSWFMPFLKQTEIACAKVKKMSELSEGYNIIGLSQGNMVGRGLIEFCDGAPPVKNFISLAGPHAGIASVPFCGSALLCIFVDFIMKFEIYSDFFQEHLAPAGYIKIPTDIDDYLKKCKFLPKLNNEYINHKNSTYKERFTSLENLVLIMFEDDKVLVPKETSLFGYYPDGSWNEVLAAQETKLYTEDWIGLKTLDEAGKVKFINVSGGHLEISLSDIKTHILPYLEEEEQEASTQLATMKNSFIRPSSILNFIQHLTGLTGEQRVLQLHTLS